MIRNIWAAVCWLAISSMLPTNNYSVRANEPGLLFAHRGGAHEFEENTLAAFQASYERGLRGFETDVRMTKDGQFVLLHDDDLQRTCRASGPVESKTSAELRTVVTKEQGLPLLFLDELLAYFADKPGVYLELEMKTRNRELYPDERLPDFCRKLHQAALARKPKSSVYVFTSFDDRPLRIIHSLDKTAELLYITDGPGTPEFVDAARTLGVRRIGVNINKTSRAAVRHAQQQGLIVSGWPGHNLQDYHLAVGLGLDAICTDVPIAIQTWKESHE